MSNLTDISISTRKVFIWIIIVIISYFILRLLWNAFTSTPVAPPSEVILAPNTKFGKLPPLLFEHISTSSSGLKFSLENIEGKPLPATPSARVYLMPKKLPSILGTQRVKNFAAKLRFVNEPEMLSATHFIFYQGNNNENSLEIDSINMNYRLKYDFAHNPDIFSHNQNLNTNAISSEILAVVRNYYLVDGSLLSDKLTTRLLAFDPSTQQFEKVANFTKANSARIDFFRSIDGWKILPPMYDQSFNYILYTPGGGFMGIIELNYFFWTIASNDYGTYPLKTADQAWLDLVDGYAYVIRMGENTADKTIIIRNIYLAYYDTEQSQNYLQPIFVIEGDKNFVAYVPAIAGQWWE